MTEYVNYELKADFTTGLLDLTPFDIVHPNELYKSYLARGIPKRRAKRLRGRDRKLYRHAVNLRGEISNDLTREIRKEIDAEIIRTILNGNK